MTLEINRIKKTIKKEHEQKLKYTKEQNLKSF